MHRPRVSLVRVVLGEVCEQYFAVTGCLAVVHRGAQIGCNEPVQVAIHHVLRLARYNISSRCQYADHSNPLMDMIKSSSIDRDLCSLVARPRVLHHLVRREHVIPDLLPEGGLYLVT